MIGIVAKCSRGEVGLITGQKVLPWGLSWVGIPLNRTGRWASQKPLVLAYCLPQYLAVEEIITINEVRREALAKLRTRSPRIYGPDSRR